MERRIVLFKAWLGYVPLLFFGLLFAYSIQVYVYYRDLEGAVSLLGAVEIAAIDVALWVFISPLIIALYTELVSKSSIKIQILIQGLAAFGFAAMHVALDGLVNVWLARSFLGSYSEFLNIFLYSKLFMNLAFYSIIVLILVAVDFQNRVAGLVARLEINDRKQVDLMLHDGHRKFRVPLAEILWIEAANNYIGVHTLSGTEIARDTLSRMEGLLPRGQFARVHRGAIVGMGHARQWQPLARGDGQLTLTDGSTVRVSRRFKESIQNWLEDQPV
jgi:hypothetical protein